jgi:hypothetical protein
MYVKVLMKKKKWEVYHLYCILSVFSSSHTVYFASSQFFHLLTVQHRSWRLFFIVWRTYFLALSETMHLLPHPTISHIPDLTEEFSVCTSGTLRKMGWILAIPDTKILCQDQICVTRTGRCWPKVPSANIWLLLGHVAYMLVTFPARIETLQLCQYGCHQTPSLAAVKEDSLHDCLVEFNCNTISNIFSL